MSAILVVGASGFLGLHAIARLSAAGHHVFGVHSPGKVMPAQRNVQWISTDLREANIAAHWPTACDRVVFLAQAGNWRDFPSSAADVLAINVRALQQTAEYARCCGARSVVVASTGSVYPDRSKPALESDTIPLHSRRDFYSASKIAAEVLLGPYGQLFPIIQFRIFLPYGEGLGSDKLFCQLTRKVRMHEPIELQGQDGMTINPLDARDAAEALDRALHLEQSHILNLAGPEIVSLRQVGTAIGDMVGQRPVFELQPGTTAPTIVGDLTRLRQALDWQPQIGLAQGLRDWLGVDRYALAS